MSLQICSKCKVRPCRTGQRTCLLCHAEWMKDYRARTFTVPLVPHGTPMTDREAFAILAASQARYEARRAKNKKGQGGAPAASS